MLKRFGLLIFALLAFGQGALAQMPQRTSATYGDWTLACALTAAGKRSCGVVQLVRGKALAAQIGIGRTAAEDRRMVFNVQTAANVWLPGGVRLTLGDASTLSAYFEWCASGRCLADDNLTGSDVMKLRAEKDSARLSYKNAAQAEVTMPVSFIGFDDAMDAFEKQQ